MALKYEMQYIACILYFYFQNKSIARVKELHIKITQPYLIISLKVHFC